MVNVRVDLEFDTMVSLAESTSVLRNCDYLLI